MIDHSTSAPRLVRFSIFELDLRSGELRKAGVRLNLPDQPLQFLTALLERPDQLVTRDELRQRLWPADTFVDFEHGLNAVVSRLRETLGDSAETPRFIETVPRRGYRFIAPVEGAGLTADDSRSPPMSADSIQPNGPLLPPSRPLSKLDSRGTRWRLGATLATGAVAATAVVVLGLAGARRLPRSADTPAPVSAMRVVRLTAMSGFEAGGLSPDGRQVAFDWEGEKAGISRDIYVKFVESSEMHRLTTDPAGNIAPTWSRDGRQIAYVRTYPSPRRWDVHVMSSLVGSDRKVSDFPVGVPVSWSPDGRYLVTGRAGPPDAAQSDGIYLIPVQGGEPRAVTRPRAPEVHQSPKFSPDGHRLAYVSCDGPIDRTNCQVNVLNVDASYAAAGPSRRLTRYVVPTGIVGLTWSRDGASVIYGAEELGFNYLWRVDVAGERPPERIELAGVNAVFPSVALESDRLIFTRFINDEDIYRFQPGRPAQAIARSSVFDSKAQFSPDGRRIAFCSQRSGDAIELWVADSDGSTPTQLTHGPGRSQCSPTWSPSGRRIAFESQSPEGSWHIWTVDVDGGTPQQITKDPGDQNMPTWSRDGDWIYFSWKPANERDMWRRDIWRTRVGTGAKERLTHGGDGLVGRESADGKTLLYHSKLSTSPLLAQALAGGEPRTLIACVTGSAVSVTQAGLYYVPCSDPLRVPNPPVRVMDPATGTTREIGTLENFHYGFPSSFSVSPDRRTILYGREVNSGGDLMMIENFR